MRPLCKVPFPSLLPLLFLLLTAFLLARVCAGPHIILVGVPPPPNSAFLDRGTFVWGLDEEQGAFEWLAEDWGHGEGQGQERGGSALATSWTPGDPQHHLQGGEKDHKSQARERVLWGVCSAGQGRWFQGQSSALGWEKGSPTSQQGGAGRGRRPRNVHPDTCFLYVVPLGNFSIPGPRLGQALPQPPLRKGQSLQGVEGHLGWGQSKRKVHGREIETE